LAGLSKPTWLSLICRKVSPAALAGLRVADDPERMRQPARHGPQHAGDGPGHVFQDFGRLTPSWRCEFMLISFAPCVGLAARRSQMPEIYSRAFERRREYLDRLSDPVDTEVAMNQRCRIRAGSCKRDAAMSFLCKFRAVLLCLPSE
jgi:hypothetical protein